MTQAQKSARKKQSVVDNKESEGLSFDAMDKALVVDYNFEELNIKTQIEIDLEAEERAKAQQEVQQLCSAVDTKQTKDENGLILEDKEDAEAE